MPDSASATYTFRLTDPVTRQSVHGQLTVDDHVLAVTVDGYGDKESAPGQGTPVFLEFYDGQLRVNLWHDINTADPVTHGLEGARECLRR